MATAGDIITDAMRLYGILDQTETPEIADLTNNTAILNKLLRSEHVDGVAQYTLTELTATVPAGTSGQTSSFVIGTASPNYLVQSDAVAVKAIWCMDIGPTVRRETRIAPSSDVLRTTNLGRITKWRQRRQVDGSINVTVWQPPQTATPILIECGLRIAALTQSTDTVALPPEGLHDAAMLLGRRIAASYGRSAQAVAVQLADAQMIHDRWKDWARGQQWLRMVRA